MKIWSGRNLQHEKRRKQACKPNFVPRRIGVMIIPLAPQLLAESSDLPEGL